MKRIMKGIVVLALLWAAAEWLFLFSLNYALCYDMRPQPTGFHKALLPPAQFIAYSMVISPAIWICGAGGPVITANGQMHQPRLGMDPYSLIHVVCLAYAVLAYLIGLAALKWRRALAAAKRSTQPAAAPESEPDARSHQA